MSAADAANTPDTAQATPRPLDPAALAANGDHKETDATPATGGGGANDTTKSGGDASPSKGGALTGMVARLAAKRLAKLQEPEPSEDSTAGIAETASVVVQLEAAAIATAAEEQQATKAARAEGDAAVADQAKDTVATEQTVDEAKAELTTQLKRLMKWLVVAEPTIDILGVSLAEPLFASIVCGSAIVRETARTPSEEASGLTEAQIAELIGSVSADVNASADDSRWPMWIRHMLRVAWGHTKEAAPPTGRGKLAEGTKTKPQEDAGPKRPREADTSDVVPPFAAGSPRRNETIRGDSPASPANNHHNGNTGNNNNEKVSAVAEAIVNAHGIKSNYDVLEIIPQQLTYYLSEERAGLSMRDLNLLREALSLGQREALHLLFFLHHSRVDPRRCSTRFLCRELGIEADLARLSAGDTRHLLARYTLRAESPPQLPRLDALVHANPIPTVTDVCPDLPPAWNIARYVLVKITVEVEHSNSNSGGKGHHHHHQQNRHHHNNARNNHQGGKTLFAIVMTDLRGRPVAHSSHLSQTLEASWNHFKNQSELPPLFTPDAPYVIGQPAFASFDARILCPDGDGSAGSTIDAAQAKLVRRLLEPAKQARMWLIRYKRLSNPSTLSDITRLLRTLCIVCRVVAAGDSAIRRVAPTSPAAAL